jgi:hypothetical protein
MSPVAEQAYDDLMMDISPSPAAMVDLGIVSDDHHRAMQRAVRNGATKQDLSNALMGNTEGLNNFIARFAPQWAGRVTFTSPYDMFDEDWEEGED